MTSTRSSNVSASVTMAISAMAKQMKADGQDVLGFSAGEPDFPTPAHIKAAGIQAIENNKTTYTAADGMPDLKAAIIEKFKRDQGLTYDAKQIVVSCGAKHSIYTAMMALLNPGDEVLIPSPYWVSYPEQVKLAEGVPVILETDDASGFKVSPEQLESAIGPKTKVFFLNSPSNPTGSVYTQAEIEALAAVIDRHDMWVMSDEIYEELIYDGSHYSIAQVSGSVREKTILINGLSKAYAMTGWRIGYTATTQALASAMSRIQSHSTSNPATPCQFAGLAALNGSQEVVAKMRGDFSKRRGILVDGLNAIPGISCLSPSGAFYAFPNISALFGKHAESGLISDSVTFCEQLLKDAKMACVPGAGFGSEGFIRMSYATSLETIQDGLQRLGEFVARLR